MKLSRKLIFKGVAQILTVFIILTFIIMIVTIPKDIHMSFEGFKFHSNVNFNNIQNNIVEYYKVLFSGSFGKVSRGTPVWEYIKVGFSKSLTLIVGSIIISVVVGIIKGIFDSRKGKKSGTTLKLLTTVMGLSMPDVFVIIVVQSVIVWLFKHGIEFIPVAGYETARHAIAPMISLSIIPTMYIARITAVSMNKIFEQDYIKTALGKGASRLRIIIVHVLKNAMVEIADSFSSVATILLSSLIIVEHFFNYTGLAQIMYNNYQSEESNVVIASAIIMGLIYIVIDVTFKTIKFVLNPRVRSE